MSGLFTQVVERSVLIEATPWNIWKILINLSEYGGWNSLYPEAAGDLRPGSDVRTSMRFVGATPSSMVMRVIALESCKELVWTSSYAFPGFLDMVHCFIIAPVDRYGSRFTHGVRFSGLLTPLYSKAVRKSLESNMEMMTAALKAMAEVRC